MALTIPDSLKKGLIKIQELTQPQFEALTSSLASMKPTLLDADRIEKFEVLPDSITANDLRAIIETTLGLHAATYTLNEDVNSLIDDVLHSRNASDFVSQSSTLRERLGTLLNLESLKTSAKALNLFSESQAHLISSRVVTDLRPVFGDRTDTNPIAAIVTHTLKIEYHDIEGRKDLYLHVTPEDMKALQDDLQRASEKHNALIGLASKASLPIIEAQAGESNA